MITMDNITEEFNSFMDSAKETLTSAFSYAVEQDWGQIMQDYGPAMLTIAAGFMLGGMQGGLLTGALHAGFQYLSGEANAATPATKEREYHPGMGQ